jgi:hypothetical protein
LTTGRFFSPSFSHLSANVLAGISSPFLGTLGGVKLMVWAIQATRIKGILKMPAIKAMVEMKEVSEDHAHG